MKLKKRKICKMDHRKTYSWEGITSCGAGYSDDNINSRQNRNYSSAQKYDFLSNYSSPETKYETN